MALGIFAGIPVRDYEHALDWYRRLPTSATSLPVDLSPERIFCYVVRLTSVAG